MRQAVDTSYVWEREKGSKPCIPDRIKPYLPKDSILLLREAVARRKPDEQAMPKRERLEREPSEEAEAKRKPDEQEKREQEQREEIVSHVSPRQRREELEQEGWRTVINNWRRHAEAERRRKENP